MIDGSVPAIFASCNYVGFDGLSLRSNARLRKHEQMSFQRWLMASNIMCAIIQSQKLLMIYKPVYSQTAPSTGTGLKK